ncbi:hypothetical protein AFLA_007020 [Aspergillus flavus NRRL3357]|nr:hypothetical protein AFLA_007020 [Aspergillus flavus NRRL3357]
MIYAARKAVATSHGGRTRTPPRPVNAIYSCTAFSNAIELTAERLDFAIACNAPRISIFSCVDYCSSLKLGSRGGRRAIQAFPFYYNY